MEPVKGQEGEQIIVDIAPSAEQVDIHISGKDGNMEDVIVRTNEKIQKVEIIETEKEETVEIITQNQEIDVAIHERHHEETDVKVNHKPVRIHGKVATGAKIKADAIIQGVAIKQDFNLFEKEKEGELKPVADTEPIRLYCGQEFRAVAPDDNSQI